VKKKGPQRKEKTVHFGFQKIPEREKTERVGRHFDIVARRYDMMNTLLSFGIHYAWKRKAVGLLALNVGDVVIDCCGGTGDLSILASKRVGPRGGVILYDINRMMIEAGRRKASNAAARREIAYVQGDAERIAFKSGAFDAAMVGFGVRNLAHMEKGLREMHRVVKRDGRFICLEFSRPIYPLFRLLYDFYSFYIMPFVGLLFAGSRQAYTYLPESIRMFPSPRRLTTLLEKVGFREVTCQRLTNGIAVVHQGIKQ
jgi:demethylmenaquinone methyltransferase/2-methoxy-6-polyprenyl-1,4-benzoquinol methylase